MYRVGGDFGQCVRRWRRRPYEPTATKRQHASSRGRDLRPEQLVQPVLENNNRRQLRYLVME